MFFVFSAFCLNFESNITYLGTKFRYGFETKEFAYFGSEKNPCAAIDLNFKGVIDLPAAIKVKDKIVMFQKISSFAFSNSKISGIILPNDIKWIEKSAFENCTQLKSIDFSKSNICYLGDRCFYGCKTLTDVILPNSMNSLGVSCFEFAQLQTFPEPSFNSIGKRCFANNHEIVEADLTRCKFRTINESLFENCTRLNTVFFPKNLFSIEAKAFANTAMNSVEIPSTTKIVHKFLYKECLNIFEANLCDYPINCISDGMFCNCVNLKKVILPETCYWIGDFAFYNTSIEEFEPREMTYRIGPYCFAESKLKKIDFSLSVVEVLSEKVFFKCKNLKKIVLSPYIRKIEGKFIGKTYIRYFTGDFTSLESLSFDSFHESSIQKIDFGKSEKLTELPSKLFENIKTLTDITLPPNIVTIHSYAFNSSSVSQVIFPKVLMFIHEGAFANCQKICSIDLSETKIRNITKSCFEECSNLENVLLPKYVQYIEDKAFCNCKKLRTVDFPQSLLIIGNCAFYQCISIKECILDKTDIQMVLDSAFEGCIKLKTITLSSSMIGTGYKAFAFTAVDKIVITGNIGSYCFYGCNSLTTVDMSESNIKTLYSPIFGNCKSLVSVLLPKELERIGKSVFSGCTNIKTVKYSGGIVFNEEVFPPDVNFV